MLFGWLLAASIGLRLPILFISLFVCLFCFLLLIFIYIKACSILYRFNCLTRYVGLYKLSQSSVSIAENWITLKDPDNSIVVSGKLSLSQISVYQIDSPKTGAWTLSVSGSSGEHEFFVKSSSETNVDFEHYFITTLPGRSRSTKEVSVSRPTAGMFRILLCWSLLAHIDNRLSKMIAKIEC